MQLIVLVSIGIIGAIVLARYTYQEDSSSKPPVTLLYLKNDFCIHDYITWTYNPEFDRVKLTSTYDGTKKNTKIYYYVGKSDDFTSSSEMTNLSTVNTIAKVMNRKKNYYSDNSKPMYSLLKFTEERKCTIELYCIKKRFINIHYNYIVTYTEGDKEIQITGKNMYVIINSMIETIKQTLVLTDDERELLTR